MEKPTEKNKRDIINYLVEQGHEKEVARDFVKTAHIGRIKKYIPDSPGWIGEALMIVWSGDITFFEVLSYEKNGKLKRVPPEITDEKC